MILPILFGAIVGFSLGLTGGGGSIFAVPLLVYGLGVPPREAVGISLATVGATSLIGCIQRLRAREVETGLGLLFAVAGMLGAPVGSIVGRRIPESVLLVLFSGLMVFVAARMWRKASRKPDEARVVRARFDPGHATDGGPACRIDPAGRLQYTSRCVAVMCVVGLLTGVLSGLFGVGGGFIIVPALMFFTNLSIHRAVATSLMVITLIGASGVAAHVSAIPSDALQIVAPFVIGGAAGMGVGILTGRRISGPGLQKVFAAAILLIACFVALRTLV